MLCSPRLLEPLRRSLAASAIALAAPCALAQSLVADLVPGTLTTPLQGVMPVASVPGAALFFADDPVHLSRLWRTDGTPGGTFVLASSGQVSASTTSYVWNGVAYYQGSSVSSGGGLWRSDGTPDGTYLLRSDLLLLPQRGFAPGPGGRLYFFAMDLAHGTELWSTDGTRAGTSLVVDLRPGGASSLDPEGWPMQHAGPWFYFRASHDGGVARLWRTDGTAANTTMVVPGVGGYRPHGMADLGGQLLYASDDPSGTSGPLWRTDGTVAGTQQVTPGPVSIPNATDFAVVNGRYLFNVFSPSTGFEPYATDGTSISWLGDLNPGPANSRPQQFVTLGGFAYFLATTAAAGTELWRTDGTATGTQQVADLVPGPDSTGIDNLTVANGALWFSTWDAAIGVEPWRSDGTAAGTVSLGDLNPGPASSSPSRFIGSPNGVLFRGDRAELDGTACAANGSSMAVLLQPQAGADAAIRGMVSRRGRVFFTARLAASGSEPWVSDGTAAGTQMLVDATPGGADTYVSPFVDYRGATWFLAGQRLWRTGGTAATTSLAVNGEFTTLAHAGDWLYLSTSDQVLRTDGTAAGTTTVFGPTGMMVGGVYAHGDRIVFMAAPNSYQLHLYRSDGTPTGNQIVFTSNSGGFGLLNGFVADHQTLWISDRNQASGTVQRIHALPITSGIPVRVYEAAETYSVLSLYMPPFSPRLAAFGGECYFSTNADRELWRTNGTAPATVLDVRPGPEGSSPADLLAGDGFLYFSADDGSRGRELWRTDGTMAGTSVLDVIPGAGGLAPTGIRRLDDGSLLAFQGSSPSGAEPWISNGTLAGTVALADLRPGMRSSFPAFGAVAGHDLLFVADDGVVGAELWRVPVASLGGTLARNFGQPCFHPGGHLTSIAARGVPRLGNSTFAFELHGAEPLTFAALLVGFGAANVPLSAACRLWVQDPVLLVSFTDGSGSTAVGLSIPSHPTFLGLPLAGQFLALDPPGGPSAFALSDGLSILIGN